MSKQVRRRSKDINQVAKSVLDKVIAITESEHPKGKVEIKVSKEEGKK
ncbi:hypothetical protein ACFFGT_09495 [Mucilaginibacter angelicae]|uniref:Uncharacterized protein n=1 Tax=Mucilaginibacter angelicae TaxID=869718 RepID=A0ABV6L4N3_9SPHI